MNGESKVVHQETEGILSPLIRDMRLRKVASCIQKDSLVLDIACGAGYLSNFLPEGCHYYGVDRMQASSNKRFTDFLALDVLGEHSFEQIEQWLPRKPDYITCIAFLEHIDHPGNFVQYSHKLLATNGRFIGTTPHPCGRLVHDSLSKIYLCSRHGAEEHTDFLGKKEIEDIARNSGGVLATYRRFLLGLNQLFVIKYD